MTGGWSPFVQAVRRRAVEVAYERIYSQGFYNATEQGIAEANERLKAEDVLDALNGFFTPEESGRSDRG